MPDRRWIVACGLATLAGFVLVALPGAALETTGVVILSLVLAAVIALIVARLGPQSQPDREREERAREEFERTGNWPAE